MITAAQMKKIIAFSKKESLRGIPLHRWQHIEDTVKIAKFLARKEGGDMQNCIAAAYLHDISKRKEPKINHGTDGARRAEAFLKKIGVDEKTVEEVSRAIYEHNKTVNERARPLTSKILYDADKLQAAGCGFVTRCLAYRLKMGQDLEEAMKTLPKEYEFYMARLKTRTAKRISRQRHKLVVDFLKDYRKNWWK